jgi:hypothetical protein
MMLFLMRMLRQPSHQPTCTVSEIETTAVTDLSTLGFGTSEHAK